jgi:hypothetical protein
MTMKPRLIQPTPSTPAPIAVDKGIPIPTGHYGKIGAQYPFNSMEPGDSFFIPATNDLVQKTRSQINTRMQKRNLREDRKFILRRVDGGFRVWRTE